MHTQNHVQITISLGDLSSLFYQHPLATVASKSIVEGTDRLSFALVLSNISPFESYKRQLKGIGHILPMQTYQVFFFLVLNNVMLTEFGLFFF